MLSTSRRDEPRHPAGRPFPVPAGSLAEWTQDCHLLFGVKSIFFFYLSNYYFGWLIIFLFVSTFWEKQH